VPLVLRVCVEGLLLNLALGETPILLWCLRVWITRRGLLSEERLLVPRRRVPLLFIWSDWADWAPQLIRRSLERLVRAL
jgi:hypothetical protein